MGYPPAKSMLTISGSSAEEALLLEGLTYCRKYIESIYKKNDLLIVGPAPQVFLKYKTCTVWYCICGMEIKKS